MITWEKAGRTVKASGETTILYKSADGRFALESRKRAIPHAGGRSGSWMHTSYFLRDRETEDPWKEFYAMKDAKEAAEKILRAEE